MQWCALWTYNVGLNLSNVTVYCVSTWTAVWDVEYYHYDPTKQSVECSRCSLNCVVKFCWHLFVPCCGQFYLSDSHLLVWLLCCICVLCCVTVCYLFVLSLLCVYFFIVLPYCVLVPSDSSIIMKTALRVINYVYLKLQKLIHCCCWF